MKKLNFILNIIIFLIVIIILFLLLKLMFEPYFMNANTNGDIVDDEKIYNVMDSIISKKYEIILYEDYRNIYNLYSFNNKEKLESEKTKLAISCLKENYKDYKIFDIKQKNTDIYIIKYYEEYNNNNSKEQKVVIKYNNNDNRAIIYYDSMFEVNIYE